MFNNYGSRVFIVVCILKTVTFTDASILLKNGNVKKPLSRFYFHGGINRRKMLPGIIPMLYDQGRIYVPDMTPKIHIIFLAQKRVKIDPCRTD